MQDLSIGRHQVQPLVMVQGRRLGFSDGLPMVCSHITMNRFVPMHIVNVALASI